MNTPRAPLRTFRADNRPAAERIGVTIITGFLGSGKTTLVNHILSNRTDVRAAVLVNDIGELGIDNDLIIASDGGTVSLSNGCICCSINNDLVEALVGLLMRAERIDHLIIETSGAADPLPVALTFLRPEFRGSFRLDAIVATADAEAFSLDLFDGVTARNQLCYADAILLNKSDRVSVARQDHVEAMLRRINPEARIVRTAHSVVPLPLILDLNAAHPSGLHVSEAAHLAADGIVTVTFTSHTMLSLPRFQSFLNSGRPAGLFRAKGFLTFAETGRSYLFHLVGSRFSLDEDDRLLARETRMVLIGRSFNPATLRAQLLDCCA